MPLETRAVIHERKIPILFSFVGLEGRENLEYFFIDDILFARWKKFMDNSPADICFDKGLTLPERKTQNRARAVAADPGEFLEFLGRIRKSSTVFFTHKPRAMEKRAPTTVIPEALPSTKN